MKGAGSFTHWISRESSADTWRKPRAGQGSKGTRRAQGQPVKFRYLRTNCAPKPPPPPLPTYPPHPSSPWSFGTAHSCAYTKSELRWHEGRTGTGIQLRVCCRRAPAPHQPPLHHPTAHLQKAAPVYCSHHPTHHPQPPTLLTGVPRHCIQLRLDERQVQVTLRRRQRLAIHIGAQAHPCIQYDGGPVCVYSRTTAETAVCVKRACRWHHCVGQVLPVDEVCAHCVAPHKAKGPLTPLRQMLVEPVRGRAQ
jgi:hypothetical protein